MDHSTKKLFGVRDADGIVHSWHNNKREAKAKRDEHKGTRWVTLGPDHWRSQPVPKGW